MTGWIARDKNGDLSLFREKPIKGSRYFDIPGDIGRCPKSVRQVEIQENDEIGKGLTWEDDPIKVKIVKVET